MGCPLRNPPLFTLKLLIVLKSRIVAKSQTLAYRARDCGGDNLFHIRSNFCSF